MILTSCSSHKKEILYWKHFLRVLYKCFCSYILYRNMSWLAMSCNEMCTSLCMCICKTEALGSINHRTLHFIYVIRCRMRSAYNIVYGTNSDPSMKAKKRNYLRFDKFILPLYVFLNIIFKRIWSLSTSSLSMPSSEMQRFKLSWKNFRQQQKLLQGIFCWEKSSS